MSTPKDRAEKAYPLLERGTEATVVAARPGKAVTAPAQPPPIHWHLLLAAVAGQYPARQRLSMRRTVTLK